MVSARTARPSPFAGGASRPPHPALRRYVTSVTGYHDVLETHAVHHGVASATITVILAFDEPIDCGWLAAPEIHTAHWSMVAGLHLAPALIRTHGFQHGIQLSLTPFGMRALLGLPAGAVAGDMVGTDDLGGLLPPQVHARLAEAPTWAARLDLLEDQLLTTLAADEAAQSPVEAELTEAWRLLAASHGTARIEQVARQVGWSRRRLGSRFRAEYGVAPKAAARLLRFDHARQQAREGLALADVAARAGYADQAHLSREWRELAGATPRQTLTTPYIDDPFVQDEDRSFPAA